MFNKNILRVILAFVFSCLINITVFAAQSATTASDQSPIKIGMTTVLSGPSAKLGLEMKKGIDTYFAEVNAKGGIDGRKIVLITLDDKYEPNIAAPNMRELIEKDQVLAIIGNVGTPTAAVTIPIANELHTLLFGAFSGAGILRKTPPDRYVINFRASYKEETAEMVKGLLSIGIKPADLAFFTQNDAYGDSGYEDAMDALKASGYLNPEALPLTRYTRNTLNIEAAFAQLLSAPKPPKAIIMVGTYAPVIKFIKLAKKNLPHMLFLNVSFVGSEALAHESRIAQTDTDMDTIVTQVVPAINSNLAAVVEYRENLKKYSHDSTPSFGSLEGYLAAKLFVMGLQSAAKAHKLNREGIIDSFESMQDVDLGIGIKISFDKNRHQALHMIWPTILKEGKFVGFQWSDLKIKK
jgi:branched-chain amino acid transport system substrate-binding protein